MAGEIETKARALDAKREEKSGEGEADELDREENIAEGSTGLAREYSEKQGMVEFGG